MGKYLCVTVNGKFHEAIVDGVHFFDKGFEKRSEEQFRGLTFTREWIKQEFSQLVDELMNGLSKRDLIIMFITRQKPDWTEIGDDTYDKYQLAKVYHSILENTTPEDRIEIEYL
jgi:hypothetical protein